MKMMTTMTMMIMVMMLMIMMMMMMLMMLTKTIMMRLRLRLVLMVMLVMLTMMMMTTTPRATTTSSPKHASCIILLSSPSELHTLAKSCTTASRARPPERAPKPQSAGDSEFANRLKPRARAAACASSRSFAASLAAFSAASIRHLTWRLPSKLYRCTSFAAS